MQLFTLFLLTTVVHLVGTGAYAARLAGVRTGRPALANSLYSALALIARGANTLAGPLLASLTDRAVAADRVSSLAMIYRWMMLAASAGTLVASVLIPSLSRLLAAGVLSYERRRSLPRVIVRSVSVRGLGHVRRSLTQPRLRAVVEARQCPFPKRFLLASVLVTSLFTVGNFAALYASALAPESARTAASLSPLFTGLGAVLGILWIDPVAAFVCDQALRGERPLGDVTYVTIWQLGARLVGTVLAQALLWPVGQGMAISAHWLVG